MFKENKNLLENEIENEEGVVVDKKGQRLTDRQIMMKNIETISKLNKENMKLLAKKDKQIEVLGKKLKDVNETFKEL